MFREMRRKNQALPMEECEAIMRRATSGVLAVIGDAGYPYAVPLSFFYDSGRLYFHCAKTGHKLDAIIQNPKASFCVIDQDQVVPEVYSSSFRSVIAFGTVHILKHAQEKHSAIESLARKYAPHDSIENQQREIESSWENLCMLEMQIAHMTGKEASERIKAMQKSKDS